LGEYGRPTHHAAERENQAQQLFDMPCHALGHGGFFAVVFFA